jgi:hypothetical protein
MKVSTIIGGVHSGFSKVTKKVIKKQRETIIMKMLKRICKVCILCVILLIAGCASTMSRYLKCAIIPQDNQKYVLKMCGKPDRCTSIVVGDHIYTIYQYNQNTRLNNYIYFKDGIVTQVENENQN